MAATAWQIQGQYYENCNCDFVCPCVPGQMMVKPTKGSCTFAMAFQIERGRFGDIPLDGLGFVVVAVTPEEMAKGNWSVGVVVDEQASAEQREAITGIASGAAGGPMAALAGLVGKFLGVESSPIVFQQDGASWSVNASSKIRLAGPGRDRAESGRRPHAAVEHGASGRRHVHPCAGRGQSCGGARRLVGGCERPKQCPVRTLRMAERVGARSAARQRIAAHTATASRATPLALAVCSPNGANFSTSTHSVRATMTTRFMTPPAKSSSISAQQQPRQ